MQKLPKPNSKTPLSKSGYSLKKTQPQRRMSLNKASKKTGTLPVLKRLNLIRNLTKRGSINRQKLTKDVEYMKHKYSLLKKQKANLKNN